jgi:hypothetical protein
MPVELLPVHTPRSDASRAATLPTAMRVPLLGCLNLIKGSKGDETNRCRILLDKLLPDLYLLLATAING